MNTDNVLMGVRLFLHIGGTLATTLGWFSQNEMNAITEAILQVVGPLMNAGGLIWTAWASRNAAKIASVAKMPEVKAITLTDDKVAEVAKAVAPETKITVSKTP
jgi:hypothetical protein